jgi:hypothetical protein
VSRFPDINVVDENNSSTVLLGPSGNFTGLYTDVSGFTSVSVLISSDRASAANGLRLQWSSNGTVLDDEQRFTYGSFTSEQAKVIHAVSRSKFFRVSYTNTSSAQTFMRLQALLRRGPAMGSVAGAGIQITTEYDATVTNSVLAALDNASPGTIVFPRATSDPFLITTPPPNTSVVQNETTVTASLSAVDLDFFGIFGPTRHHFHVYNDTLRGNLYIRFGSSPTLTNYNVKVPPRHFYELPQSWRRWPGSIKGIWDVADGTARCTEWF